MESSILYFNLRFLRDGESICCVAEATTEQGDKNRFPKAKNASCVANGVVALLWELKNMPFNPTTMDSILETGTGCTTMFGSNTLLVGTMISLLPLNFPPVLCVAPSK